MTLLKGIDIVLIDKVENGADEFNYPIFVDKEIVVKNVIVAPVKTEDVTNVVNLTGKKAEYQLGIPKGDKNTWENREVGIESMIPLSWNRKVMVEKYE